MTIQHQQLHSSIPRQHESPFTRTDRSCYLFLPIQARHQAHPGHHLKLLPAINLCLPTTSHPIASTHNTPIPGFTPRFPISFSQQNSFSASSAAAPAKQRKVATERRVVFGVAHQRGECQIERITAGDDCFGH
jgi:hypothetical protein